MDMDTFKAALRHEPQALFNLGGGEPTCHPLFWDFLKEGVKARGRGRIWVATNGKVARHALALADMVESGEVKGVLSLDEWHEPISPEVVERWRTLVRPDGKTAVRNVGLTNGGKYKSIPIKSGRCDWGKEVCNGPDMPFVQWDGKVRQCACLDAPVVGDVVSGYSPLFQDGNPWRCWAGRGNPKYRTKTTNPEFVEKEVA